MNSKNNIRNRIISPRIGLLATGHLIYWDQFPGLKDMCMKMYSELIVHLEKIGDIITPGLVDTKEKSHNAGAFFKIRIHSVQITYSLGNFFGLWKKGGSKIIIG